LRFDERLFDSVFVRPPSDSYSACVSPDPDRDKIDVSLAKQQHREYVSILKSCDIKVNELGSVEKFPDSVFMQDAGIIGTSTVIISKFGENSRAGEAEIFAKELKNLYYNENVETKFIESPGTLEGGDVLITPKKIFVGESRRSNLIGIKQLASIAKNTTVVPIRTQLFHLLGGCTYLSNETILIAPNLVDIQGFPDFDFILVPDEEAYAANAMYVGEGRVVIPCGYPRIRSKLNEAGYTPEEVDLSEFRKGGGSVTCLCSPVYRSML
jgi:dimethylargininase